MLDALLVDLSRLQFALTAFFHLFFLPLSIGLALFIAVFETAWQLTSAQVYRQLSRFWLQFFYLNYALALLTGLAMQFQLQTHWAQYDHYIAEIFNGRFSQLAQTLILLPLLCLFIFHKSRSHWRLVWVWLLALSSATSVLALLWINAWMQNPVGAEFDWGTMRMRLDDLRQVVYNPLVISKWLHNLGSSYLISAGLVAAVASYYLLQQRHRSSSYCAIKISVPLALLGYVLLLWPSMPWSHQALEIRQIKYLSLASGGNSQLDAHWNRYLQQQTRLQQGLSKQQLFDQYRQHIAAGAKAHRLWLSLRQQERQSSKLEFAYWQQYLGYYWLLPKGQALELENTRELDGLLEKSLPRFDILRYAFALMLIATALVTVLWLGLAYAYVKRRLSPWLLRLSIGFLPLPWIAAACGWVLSEYGRQPWIIAGILPTKASVTVGYASDLYTSIAAFAILYSLLFVMVVIWQSLLIRLGPQGLSQQAGLTDVISGLKQG